VSRTFTTNFELASESVNGTATVAFGYDDDRLLTSVGALTIARHAENGLVTGTTLGLTTEAHEHNPFGEPSRQTASVNSTQVFDVQIARDDLGRITQRIEVVDGITRVCQYGYDLAGRLRTVTRNGDLVVLYTYDANGNRLSAEGEAGLVTASYDDQDRLLTYGHVSYTYGANGELATRTVASQTTSYVYDTLGNLVQVTKPNGEVITYTIDGRGRRVGKSVNVTRVKGWLYADQLRPIAELDGAGDVVSRFVYGSRANVPEYLVKNGVTYRIFSDHLGSPRVIVDASTGAIVQRMDFHAFGEIIQDSNPGFQPFGFAGGLYDPDTGVVRFGARDYDPLSAHWLAKDPMGLEAGSNVYEYTGGNPIDRVDPSGRDWFRSSSDTRDYVVGRERHELVPTGGAISRFIEHWVPAGRTFGEMHDQFVNDLKSMGAHDWYANIPTMHPVYIWALQKETVRTAKDIARKATEWLKGRSAPCPAGR